MKEQDLTQSKAILENPITLKLFIFVKSKNPESIGIREAMKATGMSSSSTVSRHLDKLEELNLIQKLPSNRFTLTSEGLRMKSFDVPITVSANLVKGNFVTVLSYELTFIVIMIISSFILLWIDKLLAAINGLLGLFVILYIIFNQWRSIKQQIDNLSKLSMESRNYAKEIFQNKLHISPNIFKIISLVFCGITGFLSVFEPFGGIFLMLIDAVYSQLIQIISIVGYICGACALITIVITVIFKDNSWVFTISTFVTAILGSLQFFIFAVSPFGEYVFSHYQYVVPLFTSILSILFFFLHIILTKRREK